MGRGSRQTVTGVVVNVRPNVPRAEYDRLKAILHRAALDGPGDLDPAHVMGRIAWVESLQPGARARSSAHRFARDQVVSVSLRGPARKPRSSSGSS